MSKKLIAGAGVVASLAVALAPLATFATDAGWNSDKHTDTLNVTVLPTCAFGAANADPIDGITHNANSATPWDASTNAASWTNGADDHLGMTPDMAPVDNSDPADGDYEDAGDINPVEHATNDTAAYSIYAGTADANMGTTTLTVVCNQNNGYKIFVEAGNLEETGGDTIDIKQTPSATVTGYNITTTTSVATATPANVTSTSKTTAVTNSAPSAEGGDAYTFTYGIGIAPETKAATYMGNVVYTLVQQLN